MRDRLKSWCGRALRRFSASERGATAVEFALVGAPFFFVFGCIMETGVMLFFEYMMQSATQEAARIIRTGQTVAGAPVTASSFKTALCGKLTMLPNCSGRVTVYVNNGTSFSNLETVMGDPVTIGPAPDGTPAPVTFNPGAQLMPATVVTTYDWTFVFPFMDFLGNINGNDARRLTGMAIFRNEPFGTTP